MFTFFDVILLPFVWALRAKHKQRPAPMSRKPPDKPYLGGEGVFRSLLFLSAAAVFAAAHVLAVSYQVQAGVQGDAQKPPIIRSATRVVNINALVIDRQGHPVLGLTKDDFQILDNGQPEKTAFFSSGEDKTAANNSTRSLAPGEYSNDPHRLGLAEEAATIILFDTLSTSYLSQAYSLGAIRIFLRQLQPEDRVGIYVLSQNGLKVVYNPSQTVAALVEAMRRYDQPHHGGAGGEATPPTDDSTGSVELDHFLRGREDRQPLGRCGGQFPLTIAAFQEIARSTIGLRGRKAVIWVTEHPTLLPIPWGEGNVLDHLRGQFGCGMYNDPDPILEEPPQFGAPPSSGHTPFVPDRRLGVNDELDLLFRLFTQNNIVLYPVSAEGLQTLRIFGPGGAATAPLTAEDLVNAVDAVANTDSHQTMDVIAKRTGGRAFYNRNDLETGIRRALDDAKYGYELAYYPDDDRWNGDWRKLQVKVNRPGVTVLSRSGYFAFSEPKLLPLKASNQLLGEIAASPLEDTEIPITVKMTPPGPAGGSAVGAALRAQVYLSAQDLFTNHGDGWKSDFEVLFFQLTAGNKTLHVTTEAVSVELSDAKYTDALKQGISTQAKLQLKPGAALLYVLVHDKKTDAVGSVRIPLDQYAVTLQ
jgi:VWFA-related protein